MFSFLDRLLKRWAASRGIDVGDPELREDFDALYVSFVERGVALRAEQDLVASLTEYIEYLSEAETMASGYLYAHNWKYPPELIERGNHLRKVIAEKEAAIPAAQPVNS